MQAGPPDDGDADDEAAAGPAPYPKGWRPPPPHVPTSGGQKARHRRRRRKAAAAAAAAGSHAADPWTDGRPRPDAAVAASAESLAAVAALDVIGALDGVAVAARGAVESLEAVAALDAAAPNVSAADRRWERSRPAANRRLVAAATRPDATPEAVARLAESQLAAAACAAGRLRSDIARDAATTAAALDPRPRPTPASRPSTAARRNLRHQQERALAMGASARAGAARCALDAPRPGGQPSSAPPTVPPDAAAAAAPPPKPPQSGLWQQAGRTVLSMALEQGRRDQDSARRLPPRPAAPTDLGPADDGAPLAAGRAQRPAAARRRGQRG